MSDGPPDPAAPGGPQAIAAGCICRPGQTGIPHFEVEKDCPLHGLDMVLAAVEAEREAKRERGDRP